MFYKCYVVSCVASNDGVDLDYRETRTSVIPYFHVFLSSHSNSAAKAASSVANFRGRANVCVDCTRIHLHIEVRVGNKALGVLE